MEYKYHPIYKYLFFFVITYAYMKHQSIMEDKILLVNSVILTIFAMIVDQMFIHNNLSIFQPLSDQYFDDNAQIKITEKQLEQELKEEIIRDWPKPPFFDGYVSMDLGAVDLTGILFAYYDFRANKIIIEDELIEDELI